MELKNTNDLPSNLFNALERYVNYGVKPGDFLSAVLSNDLFGAIGRADHISLSFLPKICSFVYNELPGNYWGSRENMKEWIAKKVK